MTTPVRGQRVSGVGSAVDTDGFGAPTGMDPHCFEVRVPPGNSGHVSVVEHFGIASGAFGRPSAERCNLPRRAWGAIRDDVKRHFNERLKEKGLPPGSWKSGVTRLERLLGQELLVLCWAIEAADASVIATAMGNWLALRPEERWWLYAMTAASTGEAKHAEIGWRKALRFALTENPVREALASALPAEPQLTRGKARRRPIQDRLAPRLPGFEDQSSPFMMDAFPSASVSNDGALGDTHAGTVFAEGCAVADRAGDTSSEGLGGSPKRAKGGSKPNVDGTGQLLEGQKTARARQGVRARRAATSHG